MSTSLTVADLARAPLDVARALPAWRRGDADYTGGSYPGNGYSGP